MRLAAAALIALGLIRTLPAGENYAFLVGVADYDRKELKPLQYTRNDVIEFRKALLDAGYDATSIVLMHDDSKTSVGRRFFPEAAKIREELRLLLADLEADDSLIVAFSGHGVQFKGERQSYFCPADARLEDRRTLIALTEIYAALKKCPARQKLLLVDACRDEPQSNASRARQSVDLESVTRPQEESRPEGFVALFSCASGERSFEDPDLKHGVFFYHVLEALRGGGGHRDSELTLDELVSFSKKKTQAFARTTFAANQRPQLIGDFTGTWVLRSFRTPVRDIPTPVKVVPEKPVEAIPARPRSPAFTVVLTNLDSKNSVTLKYAGLRDEQVDALGPDKSLSLRLSGPIEHWNGKAWQETAIRSDGTVEFTVKSLADGTSLWVSLFRRKDLLDRARAGLSASADRTIPKVTPPTAPKVSMTGETTGPDFTGDKFAHFRGSDVHVVVGVDDDKAKRHETWVLNPATGAVVSGPMVHETWAGETLSPDGRRVLTWGGNGTVRVWDAATGQPVTAPIEHPKMWMQGGTFSLDGRRIAIHGSDRYAWVYDVASGKRIFETPADDDPFMAKVTFSPDGRRLATTGHSQLPRIWDLSTGKPLTPPFAHAQTLYHAVFSPDGQRIATGSLDETARVWNAATGKQISASVKHDGLVGYVAFSADGLRIVSSGGSAAKVWEAATGRELASLQHDDDHSVEFAQFSPDGQRVVTRRFKETTVRVWNVETKQVVATLPLKERCRVAFSPDSRYLVTSNFDNTARLWDAATGQQIGIAKVPD